MREIISLLFLFREFMEQLQDNEAVLKIDTALSALNAEQHRSARQAEHIIDLKNKIDDLHRENNKLKKMVKK
jgi:hypothetical protein